MADYIISMDVDDLKESPINSEIYDFNKSQHDELVKSIEMNGLLDPLVIDGDNNIISGHRRFTAIKELGWENVDCRLSQFNNVTIALIELNRYRKKTDKELLKEANILKKEYGNKRGGYRVGVPKGKNWSIVDVSKKIGIDTTKLKKLMSIENYEPKLLDDIDLGKISVEKAYQKVRTKYILPKRNGNTYDYKTRAFETNLKKMVKQLKISKEQLISIIEKIYK